ncbi:MAG TPA: DUF92 domain-containing protein [Roseiflexaceae bacterium]|nr:DUF92 domain-containing protein [Roseiflexaceae bacterium]
MFNAPRILAGLLLSILIGGLAYWRGSLTLSGWLGAVIVGTSTFGFGGWTWGVTLIAFFVSSSALSHFRQARKQAIAGEKFEKSGRRDLAQTLANGGLGAGLALAYNLSGEPNLLLAAFVGLMATVTADTWATELGVLSPHPPRLVTTARAVEPGTSGGITAYGLMASAAGALLIGGVATVLAAIERGAFWPWLLPAALLAGLAGSLADSLLGATVQVIYRAPGGGETERQFSPIGVANPRLRGWRWMNNDLVNLLSSVAGALVAAGIFWLIGD